jgi:two-component system, OmpR family, sensor histidine kinase BaeS
MVSVIHLVMSMNKAYSLKTRLSLTYIVYILLFFVFVAILSNVLIERQFIRYSKEKQILQIEHIQERVQEQYLKGNFNPETMELIGMDAFDDGFIFGVYSPDGKMIWDANYHMGHLCNMLIDDLHGRMRAHDPGYDGKVVTQNYSLSNDGEVYGTLTIRHLSPYFYDENDLSFLKTLNQIYVISGLIFIGIAFVIASIVSKRIARPIEIVSEELQDIEKGNYKPHSLIETNTKEINQLNHSIEHLKATLLRQEQLRKQLTTDVAHELRTPLSTLQATLEAVSDGVMVADQKTMTSLYEEIIRLSRLVQDLEKLHHYEDNVQLNFETLGLEILVENTIRLYKAKFNHKNIKLSYDLQPVLAIVDRDKFNQIINNVLSNALKYTDKDGQVVVKVFNEDHEAVIMVEDNGIGITQDDLPFLFERFYRADKSRNRDTGGAGIGLSIVKTIVDQLGGTITIDSEYKKGTRVTIRLNKTR